MNRSDFIVSSTGALIAVTTPIEALAQAMFLESPLELKTPTGTIFGTLCMPSNKTKAPVVLIHAGSGPTDRDGNSPLLGGRNDSLLLLAHGLAAQGVASVRFDKRGIAASASGAMSEKDLRFDTYVNDAIAWIDLLRTMQQFTRITIAGHSEGSLIGMIAVARSSADGFVSLEGAGRPAPDVLHEQLAVQLPPEMLAQSDAIIAQLKSGKTYDQPLPASFPPGLAALFRPSVQPYVISWFKYDPAVEIARVKSPIAIVQGTADVQVNMKDAQALHGGAPSARFVVVQGMNHVLKHSPDTSSQAAIMLGYTNPALPVEPQVIDTVGSIARG